MVRRLSSSPSLFFFFFLVFCFFFQLCLGPEVLKIMFPRTWLFLWFAFPFVFQELSWGITPMHVLGYSGDS